MQLPRHIAIVMDGNGRWAKSRFLPRLMGHREGLKTVRRIIKACAAKKIEALTLFAFSSENWQRPAVEVEGLMDLFLTALQNEITELQQNNVQLRIIGDDTRFSQQLRERMMQAQQQTIHNTGLKLVIAADYGGRWDILQATKKIAQAAAAGNLNSDAITQEVFASYLHLADLPEPDLFIRTGGEIRISNFLLWQLAYTELYFTETLWPDFDEQAFETALTFYASRERRFGQTSEQIK